MLTQSSHEVVLCWRYRRRPNINPTLGQRLVFAGFVIECLCRCNSHAKGLLPLEWIIHVNHKVFNRTDQCELHVHSH